MVSVGACARSLSQIVFLSSGYGGWKLSFQSFLSVATQLRTDLGPHAAETNRLLDVAQDVRMSCFQFGQIIRDYPPSLPKGLTRSEPGVTEPGEPGVRLTLSFLTLTQCASVRGAQRVASESC
jgi:hypothetical protein